jgi:hypothetical protein
MFGAGIDVSRFGARRKRKADGGATEATDQKAQANIDPGQRLDLFAIVRSLIKALSLSPSFAACNFKLRVIRLSFALVVYFMIAERFPALLISCDPSYAPDKQSSSNSLPYSAQPTNDLHILINGFQP